MKLARLQKKLSRCRKGSNRREKFRRKVAKLQARIADIRTEFLSKLSSKLIFDNQEINLEDLNGSGMVRNHKLSRAISDLGWRQFRTMLETKAAMYGRTINVISRWEPTSQTCSTCGFKGGKKSLNIRACHQLSARSLTQWGVHALLKQKMLGAETLIALGFEI